MEEGQYASIRMDVSWEKRPEFLLCIFGECSWEEDIELHIKIAPFVGLLVDQAFANNFVQHLRSDDLINADV